MTKRKISYNECAGDVFGNDNPICKRQCKSYDSKSRNYIITDIIYEDGKYCIVTFKCGAIGNVNTLHLCKGYPELYWCFQWNIGKMYPDYVERTNNTYNIYWINLNGYSETTKQTYTWCCNNIRHLINIEVVSKIRIYNKNNCRVILKNNSQCMMSTYLLRKHLPILLYCVEYKIGLYVPYKLEYKSNDICYIYLHNKYGRHIKQLHTMEWCRQNVTHLITTNINQRHVLEHIFGSDIDE
jgi:hypothetical protein